MLNIWTGMHLSKRVAIGILMLVITILAAFDLSLVAGFLAMSGGTAGLTGLVLLINRAVLHD
ncbi:MAG: hypothetical protein JJ979_19460 [Roseibium sp.]|nr:hypothetical protein [Roseibium sp.]